ACQNGGGVGAIIYNNEAGPLLGTMGDVTTTIPSVGVSDTAGAALMNKTGTTATVALLASNYAYFDGTSMATPHVAGVAGLIWSYNPGWTNKQLRAALQATAVDLGAPGRDNAFGYGLVQAKAALDYLSAPQCEPTEAFETMCSDGIDNDCDGKVDAADGDCSTNTCDLLGVGESCTTADQCCSGKCKGKVGKRTCK
ncbi:MAG: S8 family serine peptidase, partial [Myxococcales bacterium]|nr:S8 family serine peptidase [Myxococcales bacterium]